ncbi:MAG: class I SAM-dependent methyltransferase [Gemmataceae bacterium]
MTSQVLDPQHWEVQYEAGGEPWETGRPSSELQRVLSEYRLRPCAALEFGCGTGNSAVWLAQQGFQVTAIDLSPLAIRQARQRALIAGVCVDFRVGDVTNPSTILAGFEFFFDCGCYHAVRQANGPGYLHTLVHTLRPGAHGLVLLGNAGEPADEIGPPVLTEQQVRAEWNQHFDILHLRPFRFDARHADEKHYLGWSCWLQKNARSSR